MKFLPLEKMIEQTEKSKTDGDTSYFLSLQYLGEMLTKTVVAGMVSAIVDGRERNQYQAIHKLVRAQGIGDWKTVLDEILTGPSAQFMLISSQECQRQLNQSFKLGSWQYESVTQLSICLELLGYKHDPLPLRVDLKRWFDLFALLRNKTRGHGAPNATKCHDGCEPLLISIKTIIDNFCLFEVPWAYLRQNYSGKYRVTPYTEDEGKFKILRTTPPQNIAPLKDGIYIDFGSYCFVELIESDPDASDFFYPNGSFTKQKFEMLSYITDNRNDGDSSRYLIPAIDLPPSETTGHGELDVQGECFGNIPPLDKKYISRPIIEQELFTAVVDDRHPIISLVGRGGIGKTWLAIKVLHQVTLAKRFETIIWFSARDIDLLDSGPKRVKPQILDEIETSKEFADLISHPERFTKQFNPLECMSAYMKNATLGLGPTLFVFDNFETVKDPSSFFSWIDTFIYLPNKVLITTRTRDFKGDYDVAVNGMNFEEATELIKATSIDLEVFSLITSEYKTQLIHESGGHPYIIKILLGEVAKSKKASNVERIIAGNDELLTALFERTYASLSQSAKRVFLTLCNWKSYVALLALEAVLIRSCNERIDFEEAISELKRSSLIEMFETEGAHDTFISVPLAAMLFGKKKLTISRIKMEIDSDTELLREFGNTQSTDLKSGIEPRIARIFKYVGEEVSKDKSLLQTYLPMLEFIAWKYPNAWLMIAELFEESGVDTKCEKSIDAVEKFIGEPTGAMKKNKGWEILAKYRRRTNDLLGEMHALVEYCRLPEITCDEISTNVNRINAIFRQDPTVIDYTSRSQLISGLIKVIDSHLGDFKARDFSRFAWLALNTQDSRKAKEYVEMGVKLDPDDYDIQGLAHQLGVF